MTGEVAVTLNQYKKLPEYLKSYDSALQTTDGLIVSKDAGKYVTVMKLTDTESSGLEFEDMRIFTAKKYRTLVKNNEVDNLFERKYSDIKKPDIKYKEPNELKGRNYKSFNHELRDSVSFHKRESMYFHIEGAQHELDLDLRKCYECTREAGGLIEALPQEAAGQAVFVCYFPKEA